ncbi:glycine dehydrogenase [Dictyocaulus viviparus]|uniref:glycine dehydrogenase (aminomethyl-transferring) n=1 Tax=Dictyocaulus viviparus TaxID=29172 RepID=A0A0D8XZY3_DICVI|nr:glycine dehydrogenase [Dictyocaulus viviparus]
MYVTKNKATLHRTSHKLIEKKRRRTRMRRCVPFGTLALTRRVLRRSAAVSSRAVCYDTFADRHIGPSHVEQQQMLDFLGFASLAELTNKNVPNQIKLEEVLDLPEAVDEYSMLRELKKISEMNELDFSRFIARTLAWDIITPLFLLLFCEILRRILDGEQLSCSYVHSRAKCTELHRPETTQTTVISQYTPYQAEISQGRLESLMNFQTMVADLTGLSLTNASLLDEATAVAEAMALVVRVTKRDKVLFDSNLHPQNLSVMKTRSAPLGITLNEIDFNSYNIDGETAAVIVQYPDTEGRIRNLNPLISNAHKNEALVVMVCDLMALTILKSPGDLGADIAVGSAQRFGVPLGYGGPHAGFISVRKDSKNTLGRAIPGRIVGATRDANGENAFRLALQTREQHIRRDKATSNICTAQALLANMSAMYAVYHGPKRLIEIARTIHRSTAFLSSELAKAGHHVFHKNYFDTIKIDVKDISAFKQRAEEKKMNFRFFTDGCIGVSLDETTKLSDLVDILYVFNGSTKLTENEISNIVDETASPLIGNSEHARTSTFLEHPIFNSYHSEAKLVRFEPRTLGSRHCVKSLLIPTDARVTIRNEQNYVFVDFHKMYIKRLENKDVSLAHSMIPLGSCTMKLNASSELIVGGLLSV